MANLSFSTEGTAGDADGERAIRTTRMSIPHQLSWAPECTKNAPNRRSVANEVVRGRLSDAQASGWKSCLLFPLRRLVRDRHRRRRLAEARPQRQRLS